MKNPFLIHFLLFLLSNMLTCLAVKAAGRYVTLKEWQQVVGLAILLALAMGAVTVFGLQV